MGGCFSIKGASFLSGGALVLMGEFFEKNQNGNQVFCNFLTNFIGPAMWEML